MANYNIDGLLFEGPYDDTNQVRNLSGVYFICSYMGGDIMNLKNFNVLDVGESGRLRDRLTNHPRSECWKKYSNGGTVVAFIHLANEPSRMDVENTLRGKYNLPCGKR